MTIASEDIINFWFTQDVQAKWFKSTTEFDQLIRDRYENLWLRAAAGELQHWTETAKGCLALCIVLDQLPLNMYRNHARSFETEAMAIKVSKKAIKKGYDHQLETKYQVFLYMPLMHSEILEDQDLSVAKFEEAGLQSNLRFAKHHRELIRQFGRFPHRNVILGRESTAEEIVYLNSKQAFKG